MPFLLWRGLKVYFVDVHIGLIFGELDRCAVQCRRCGKSGRTICAGRFVPVCLVLVRKLYVRQRSQTERSLTYARSHPRAAIHRRHQRELRCCGGAQEGKAGGGVLGESAAYQGVPTLAAAVQSLSLVQRESESGCGGEFASASYFANAAIDHSGPCWIGGFAVWTCECFMHFCLLGCEARC